MRGSAAFRAAVAPGGVLAGPWVRDPLWRRARAVPSLDLRFADNKSLTDSVTGASLVTFTRASSGTYVDSEGVIRTAVTNLLLRSEEFDNASWTPPSIAASVTANADIAPNGTTTADLIAGVSAAADQIYQTVTVANTTAYTLSYFIKSVDTTSTRIGIFSPPSTWLAYVDITWTAGVPTTGATLGSPTNITYTNYGNGWYRCSLTVTTATTSYQIHFHPDRTNNQKSALLWGAQLEESSTVGEYIPTTSTINSAPRFDHNPTTGESLGLLVEESRTNLLLRSEEFQTTWIPIDANITVDSVLAPNDSITADKITAFGGPTEHSVYQYFTTVSGQLYTFSCYLKAAERTVFSLAFRVASLWPDSVNQIIDFNLSAGTLTVSGGTATGSIVAVGNGWYRCSITSTAAASGSAQVRVQSLYDANDQGIYIWGAQLEVGAFPTSYIKNVDTAGGVTRAADLASIGGTAFSGWYRQDEGTVFVGVDSSNITSGRILQIGDGTSDSRQDLLFASGPINYFIVDGGSGQTNMTTFNSATTGQLANIAAGYETNNTAVVLNSGLVVTDAIATVPTVDQVGIGRRLDTSAYLNGTIRRLCYWAQRLPNSTLQTITQ